MFMPVVACDVRSRAMTLPHGRLEFSVPEMDADDFFPLQISFSSTDTYSGIRVEAVTDTESDSAVDFHQNVSLSAEQFTVE